MKKAMFVAVVVLLAIGATVSSVQAADEDRELIGSVAPATLITEVLAAEAEHDDLNLWGVRFLLRRGVASIGSVRIGVFESPEVAAGMFVRALLLSPTGPHGEVRGLGDQAVRWRGRRFFRRDNVLVDLRLDESDIDARAMRLDQELVLGGSGVARGHVDTPILLDAAMVEYRPRADLAVDRPGYTAIVDRFGQACHFDHAKEVCFATKECVMAAPLAVTQTSLTLEEPAEDPIETEPSPEHVRTLEDPRASLADRNRAVLAVMETKDESAVPALIAKVEETENLVVRQNAIRALGKIGDPRAVEPLLNILRSPVEGDIADEAHEEAILRRTAVIALGEIGDRSPLPVLRELADDPAEYQSVRELAAISARAIEESADQQAEPER